MAASTSETLSLATSSASSSSSAAASSSSAGAEVSGIAIPYLSAWTWELEEVKVDGKIEKFSIPKVAREFQGSKATYRLSRIYGERIVQSMMDRYDLYGKLALGISDLMPLIAAIAARVTADDFRDLHRRLAIIKKGSAEESVWLSVMPEEVFRSLSDLAKKKRYAELTCEDIHTLMQVFRPQKCVGEDIKAQIAFKETLQGEQKKKIGSHLDDDLVTLEIMHQWDHYRHPEMQKEAGAEYLARDAVRANLEVGMIVPYPYNDPDVPCYYTVAGKVKDHGFRFYLLSAMTKCQRRHLVGLTRGTDPNSLESLLNNLGKAAGIIPFRHQEESIIDVLIEKCEKGAIDTTLDIIGYSQGAAISCHLATALASAIVHRLDEPCYRSLMKIQKINVICWCPPATRFKFARQFAEDAYAMTQHPITSIMEFSFTYCVIDGDSVSRCGEVFNGVFRKSNNVSCHFIRFTKRGETFSDIHMLPILHKDNTPEVIERYDDDRAVDYLQEKKFEMLECLIAKQELTEKIIGLVKGKESPEQLEMLNKIAVLEEHERNELWCKEIDPEEWDLSVLEWEEEDFRHYVAHLGMAYQIKHTLQLVYSSTPFAPKWLGELETQPITYLHLLHNHLIEAARDRHELMLPQRESLCKVMQATKFMNLSPTDQYIIGKLLDWSKESLYTMLSRRSSFTQKVGAGATISAVTLGPIIGTTTLLVMAPVPTAIGLVAGGSLVGIGIGIKNLIQRIWS